MSESDIDRRRALRDLAEHVVNAPGALDRELRRRARDGEPVGDDLDAYVTKVREHAYKVVDEDFRALARAGYSEDLLFELTVSVALGVAMDRLDAVERAERE